MLYFNLNFNDFYEKGYNILSFQNLAFGENGLIGQNAMQPAVGVIKIELGQRQVEGMIVLQTLPKLKNATLIPAKESGQSEYLSNSQKLL